MVNSASHNSFLKNLWFGLYIIALIFANHLVLVNVNSIYLLYCTLLFAIPAIFDFFLRKNFRSLVLKSSTVLIAFYFCLFITYFFKENKLNSGALNFAVFALHILVVNYCLFDNMAAIKKTFFYLMVFLSIFLVFIPHYLVTQSVEFGSFYNLLGEEIIFNGTIEAPSIVTICLILSFYYFRTSKHKAFCIAIFFFSIFQLLLFSRRGLIFSSFIAIGYFIYLQKSNKKINLYWQLVLMFIPFFWDSISMLLLTLNNNELFSTLIARNEAEDYATATGRIIAWQRIINIFTSLDVSYFFGYWGDLPDSWFGESDEGDRYMHVHNTFLQLFVEGGYIVNFLFMVLVVRAINGIKKLKELGALPNSYFPILLTFFISISGSESLIRCVGISQLNFFFGIFYLLIFHESHSCAKKALTHRLKEVGNPALNPTVDFRLTPSRI
ncbi:O-antigen ligase family protein [Larkinella soli]|uniref:O-antigen ligase family protein n=1 Tax=Larkinella soli TaxID=1770527 RepID=UPI000FFCADAD|nr:O-antigen ligase family protein [Larkinella soli]